MTDRRRRGKRRKNRTAGWLCMLAVLAGTGAAAYAVPRALSEYGIKIEKTIGRTVQETVNLVPRQETEFPELQVTAEEMDGDFYYRQLNEAEQTVYRELLQGVNGMEESVMLHAGKDDRPEKVYEYLLYDRPELFWCDGSSRMTVYEDYTEFCPGYTCGREERALRQDQIDSAAAECTAGIAQEASEYERIRHVYEYIVTTVDYDENVPDNQNIYSALANKRSVCAGYSRAAQYLLGKLGIESIYVLGTTAEQDAHAWNIVKCNDKYYQMDVTFADPVFLSAESGEEMPGSIINYDYLCCTDEEIAADHVQSGEVSYPVCVSDDLNYYKMNGLYYDAFDGQILLSAMNETIYAGEEMFVCKFPDQTVYAAARDAMINDLFPRAAQNLAAAYGLERVKYTYIDDEKHFKMMVFWDYQ